MHFVCALCFSVGKGVYLAEFPDWGMATPSYLSCTVLFFDVVYGRIHPGYLDWGCGEKTWFVACCILTEDTFRRGTLVFGLRRTRGLFSAMWLRRSSYLHFILWRGGGSFDGVEDSDLGVKCRCRSLVFLLVHS